MIVAGGRPIYLATGVTDLRLGYTGLYARVAEHLQQEPLSGALFVFCNRRKDAIKIFCYDEGGFWVCAKRLEQGTFRWPASGTRTVELRAADLQLLLSGIDLTRTRLRRWWQPVPPMVTAGGAASV
jgi:transposase